MVGVANSAGCVTCRSRKVKCDLQRPACGKCIKAGRECGGYRRDRVFIIGTPQDRGRCSSHPKRAPLIPRSSNKRPHEHIRSQSTVPQGNNDGSWNGERRGHSPSSNSTSSDSTIVIQREPTPSPHSILQSTCQDLQQFIVQNTEELLMAQYFESDPKSKVPSLLSYFPEMANANPLFNRGILAFCLASAAKKHNDTRLSKASLKMSVEAMREMQATILDPNQSQRSEVLAATLCMSDCEIMIKASEVKYDEYYNWRGLIRGTNALAYERGPLSFSQYPDFQLFTRGFRGSGILEAIGRRQHTFFGSHDWLTLPWSRGIPKISLDKLFDIMAQIAGPLADVDMIIGKSTHEPNPDDPCELDPKRLLKKLFDLADAFTLWFADIQDEFNTLCTINPASITQQSNPVFPYVFSFPTFRIGMQHMYLWSSLILIYDATEKLQNFIELEQGAPAVIFQDTNNLPPSFNPARIYSDPTKIYPAPNSPPFEDMKYSINGDHILNIPAPIPSPPTLSYYSTLIREYSHNICQSLHSVFHAALSESWSVVHMLVFPLWIAVQCYHPRTEEETKFLKDFTQLMMDNDIGFAEGLCWMSFEDYAKS